MHDKNGFTLIETIFVLSIIIMISTFTLHYAIVSSPKISLKQQCQLVISLLEEAKTTALLNHQKIELLITERKISYQYLDKEHGVKLNDNYYFQNEIKLYFNNNGNINKGNHLNICNHETCKSIIFNVGSGTFYAK